MIKILKNEDFEEWYNTLNIKQQGQIDTRLENIENEEHFGDVRPLKDSLYELKWKNGWRVYFLYVERKTILLISGGHKNEQKKDIKKARLFIRRHTTH